MMRARQRGGPAPKELPLTTPPSPKSSPRHAARTRRRRKKGVQQQQQSNPTSCLRSPFLWGALIALGLVYMVRSPSSRNSNSSSAQQQPQTNRVAPQPYHHPRLEQAQQRMHQLQDAVQDNPVVQKIEHAVQDNPVVQKIEHAVQNKLEALRRRHPAAPLPSWLKSETLTELRVSDAGALPILLEGMISSTAAPSMRHPAALSSEAAKEAEDSDFGGLMIDTFEDDGTVRSIFHNYQQDKFEVRRGTGDDWYDYYYSFDDDVNRNPYVGYKDKELQKTHHCRRTSWHRTLRQNCNTFHEFDLLHHVTQRNARYLGSGSYRQVFRTHHDLDNTIVFKEANWNNDVDSGFLYDSYEFMRMDMVVGEIFSSNDIFVDMYGFCQLSMLSENMPYGDLYELSIPKYYRNNEQEITIYKLDDKEHLDPQNDLTPTQKLEYAYQMALAVSYLHNHPRGVIIHDDIQLSQFLLTKNQRVKLNDFNRAEIQLFDEERQEYCKYRNNPGHGDWRAQEEYYDLPLDEKIDIFSLGNNFFGMLTGMAPFPNRGTQAVKKMLKHGYISPIDERWKTNSFAEGKVVEAIEMCWKKDPADRVDIGPLAKFLQDAVAENRRLRGEKNPFE